VILSVAKEISLIAFKASNIELNSGGLSEAVDSGYDDPAGYSEQAVQIHLGESEFEGQDYSMMEGSTVDTEYLQQYPTRSVNSKDIPLRGGINIQKYTIDQSKSEILPCEQFSNGHRPQKRVHESSSERIDSGFEQRDSGESLSESEGRLAAERRAAACRFINGTAV